MLISHHYQIRILHHYYCVAHAHDAEQYLQGHFGPVAGLFVAPVMAWPRFYGLAEQVKVQPTIVPCYSGLVVAAHNQQQQHILC